MFNFLFIGIFVTIALYLLVWRIKDCLLPESLYDKLIVLVLLIGIGFFFTFLFFVIWVLAIPTAIIAMIMLYYRLCEKKD